MTQYIWGDTPEVNQAIQEWVSLHSFGHRNNTWKDAYSYGVMKEGRPVAGVVYHDYKKSAGTIQYSGAAIDRTWLQGPSLHYMFGYMFEDLGCQMVLTGNSADNTGLHRQLEATGHKKHVIDRAWGPETALYLWTLTREQWLAEPIFQRSKAKAKEFNHVKCA